MGGAYYSVFAQRLYLSPCVCEASVLCLALTIPEWVQPRTPPGLTVNLEEFFLALSLVLLTSSSSSVPLVSQNYQPPLLLSTNISTVLTTPLGMQLSRLCSR